MNESMIHVLSRRLHKQKAWMCHCLFVLRKKQQNNMAQSLLSESLIIKCESVFMTTQFWKALSPPPPRLYKNSCVLGNQDTSKQNKL